MNLYRYLSLVWRENFFDERTQPQTLEVVDSGGEVLGQVLCAKIEYTPTINGLGHLTATMIVEDAAIKSHSKTP